MALNAKNLGLAGGIMGAAIMLIMTLIATPTGYGTTFLNICASIYPGYTISYLGAIIGAIYGFLDGFIGLFVLGWLYNWLSKE